MKTQMKSRFVLSLAICSVGAVFSCSSPTSPTIPQWGYLNSVTGTAVLVGHDSTYSTLVAQFKNNSSQTNPFLTVGSVSMNGISLPFFASPLSYYRIDTTVQLPSDPNFTWHLIGANGIPSFDNAVTSPQHLRINKPSPGDTVYRLNGVHVEWGPIVTNGTVYLEVDDASGHVWPTPADGLQSFPDIGAANLSAAQLAGLTPGPVKIFVFRLNETVTQFGQENFDFQCLSESVLPVVMQR
jgi:hypothetical protein